MDVSVADVLAGRRAWCVEQADVLDALAGLPDDCIDAVVTDPPYGIGMMGREWDSFRPERVAALTARKRRKTTAPPPGHGHHESGGYVEYDRSLTGNQRFQDWCEAWAIECLRVLKPGSHLLACGGPRTYHRLASGIEDAGFEIRDSLHWIFGSGFPKSKNLDGAWAGFGSALKPAHEPIVLARKPPVGSITANVLTHGTGALNIDGCRVGGAWSNPDAGQGAGYDAHNHPGRIYGDGLGGVIAEAHPLGRWPPNLLLSEEAAEELDRQSGESRSRVGKPRASKTPGDGWGMISTGAEYDDAGGASRFFPVFRYEPKVDRAERDFGLPPGVRSNHPTVKPVALMLWLLRLVTPPGGIALDPFTGSGTTGVAATRLGFRFVGVEREAEYVALARARITGDAPLLNSPDLHGEAAG